MAVGKTSFPPNKIAENVQAVLAKIVSSRPSSAKGTYLRSIAVSSTMGPGIKVEISSAQTSLKGAA